MIEGYNAKPGGCGGWIVPDEKYDEWREKISTANALSGNGKWSGYSDEFIISECVKAFNEYEDKNEFSYKGILQRVRKKYPGIPKSFSKNRFSEMGGTFKEALSNALNLSVQELDQLSRNKTKTHINALKESNRGRRWYSNDRLEKSIQSKEHPGDGWYRGRKYGNKN